VVVIDDMLLGGAGDSIVVLAKGHRLLQCIGASACGGGPTSVEAGESLRKQSRGYGRVALLTL
jgi:hypothetical protein